MQFDKQKYKIWTWKHPLLLHWMINPGLAINELILGQRMPRIMLVEKNSKASLAEKTIIPCPHCQTMHNGLKWSQANNTGFKNWFGLYCDHCHKIIPCLWNLTSLVILAISFPVWIWFKEHYKMKWLQVQKEKFSKPLDLSTPVFNWKKVGIQFGIIMFLLNAILFPLLFGPDITWKRSLVELFIWLPGGLAFGYIVKLMNAPKQQRSEVRK